MTDVITFGPDRPPRRPSGRLTVAGLAVLSAVAAGTVATLAHQGGPDAPTASVPTPGTTATSCRPAGQAPSHAAPVVPVALVIGCAGGGASLNRRDRAAAQGPWTVVVRRTDGSLGRHGAVVTFPVAAPPRTGRTVDVDGVPGRTGPGTVTWPAGGTYARIRGDLPEAALTAIAARTSIEGGRPAVYPPTGYAVAGGGPYRPPDLHEIRYGSADLGEQAALGGGLAYTGVIRGGGFEDQLYATHVESGGRVGTRPAVVSAVFGGNGSLAWEPAPGVVAFVGYSGTALNDGAVAALRRLAERSRPLDGAQWRATEPQTVDQTNDPR